MRVCRRRLCSNEDWKRNESIAAHRKASVEVFGVLTTSSVNMGAKRNQAPFHDITRAKVLTVCFIKTNKTP